MRLALSRPAARTLALCALLATNGCGLPGGVTERGAAPDALAAAPAAGLAHGISHIVVVMQENRSFDNLFAGYPGANTVWSGKNSKGKSVRLAPVPLEATWGIQHNADMFFAACDGSSPGRDCKMDGFDKETAYGQNVPARNPEYGYVPHDESKLYFELAKAYVLGDNMFTSHIDASFVSHQYIIAGQAGRAVNLPSDAWGCGGSESDSVQTLNEDRSYGPSESPCFDYNTIGGELDAKGLPWRFYATASGIDYFWSSYQAISSIFNGPDWSKDVISPPAQFLTDVAAGSLASVTWITPTFADSDHATSMSNTGPDWVASIVNAVGESNFWDTSAIFVMWDEWGGWYDHVPPPYVDYDGLGVRVPLLIVSPYAKRNYVSHVQYEHGSILRFIEHRFGLLPLSRSDSRANSPEFDCFDFSAPPRPFVPFKTRLHPSDFTGAPVDPRPPDEE